VCKEKHLLLTVADDGVRSIFDADFIGIFFRNKRVCPGSHLHFSHDRNDWLRTSGRPLLITVRTITGTHVEYIIFRRASDLFWMPLLISIGRLETLLLKT
jgi:hypothetical protein